MSSSDEIREKFRQATGRRYTQYECEPFGVIRIQSLTELERMQIEFSKLDSDGNLSRELAGRVTARLIVAAVVDENNDRVFSDADVDELANLDAAIAEPLRDAIQAHALAARGDAKKN